MRNTADVTDSKPIAVLLQSISGVSAINPLVAFYDIIMEERERYYYFVLSRTPHETKATSKKMLLQMIRYIHCAGIEPAAAFRPVFNCYAKYSKQ
jgi:hypothetical protein